MPEVGVPPVHPILQRAGRCAIPTTTLPEQEVVHMNEHVDQRRRTLLRLSGFTGAMALVLSWVPLARVGVALKWRFSLVM